MYLLTTHSLLRLTQFANMGLEFWELGPSLQSEYSSEYSSECTVTKKSYILANLTSASPDIWTTGQHVEEVIELIERDGSPYAFLVHDVESHDFLTDLRVSPDQIVRVPPDTSKFDAYLELLRTVLETGRSFWIGTHDSTKRNAAGILPVLYHNSHLYAMFGLDTRVSYYSDFGGGFDRKYSPTSHKKRDSYKNAVLGKYQIQNGSVSRDMLIDHLLNLNPPDRQKFMEDLRSGQIGYGDLNTLYTAFREYVEESSGRDRAGNTQHPIPIDVVFRKLFVDKAYIHLQTEKIYGYDTFLLFVTIEDFSTYSRPKLMRQISLIRASPAIYLREMGKPDVKCGANSRSYERYWTTPIKTPIVPDLNPHTKRHSMSKTNGMPDIGIYQKLRQIRQKDSQSSKKMAKFSPKTSKTSKTSKTNTASNTNMYRGVDAGYPIYGNSEMQRIDLFPLLELLELMKDVDYDRYNFFSTGWKKKCRRYEKEYKKPENHHANSYDAPIYDRLRPSFADAMIKHNLTLLDICDRFESIKEALF